MSKRFLQIIALLAALAGGVPAAPAEAGRPKTDIVLLLNGDRVTCEITKLQAGQLVAKTDDMGTIYIEWDNVKSVSSAFVFEIEITNGVRYYGTLQNADPRTVDVMDGQAIDRLRFDDIVRMLPVEASFWKRLEGSIDSGFSYSQSLDQTQLTFNTEVTYRRPRLVSQLNFGSSLTAQENAARQTKNDLSVTTQRGIRPRWNTIVFGQAQQNEQLSLNLRTVLGGGLSRTVTQSPRTQFDAFFGAAYTNEQYSGEEGRSVGEFVAGATWDWFTYDNRSTNLSTSLITFYGFVGETRFRAESTVQFKSKIVGDLYWSTNFTESYSSKPPTGKPKNDLTISATVGWTF